MKILISSHAFAPSIGGIETVSRLLAKEFSTRGHSITVVTQTCDESSERFQFSISRRPSVSELFGLIKSCDILWHNNLSLRTLWPAVFLLKPVVITHQGSYCPQPSGMNLALRLKHAVTNRTTSVAISRYVASCFKTQSLIIPNPYDAHVFKIRSIVTERAGDLVFVGRLVSEKGLDLLLESLSRLRSPGLRPELTVVGSGPQQSALQQLATRLELHDQVKFIGAKSATEVAEILNRYKILVIPSRYDEPFGVVALEGIACGCAVVGSNGGGLPEAIGPCGLTFPNGDIDELAKTLEKLLREPNECRRFVDNGPQHLARFQPTIVANSYLDLFRSKLQ